MKRELEIVVESVESAKAAASGGADRLELCENLAGGGVTPSHAKIERVIKKAHVPVHVLVRPRVGDFLYSDHDFDIMCRDIETIRQLGAAGVVTGVVTAAGELDMIRMAKLMEHADGLEFTCHRAFDMCADHMEALDNLIALGATRVLTSGGRPTALEGIELIVQLIERASGRIQIMAGAGVRPENVQELMRAEGLAHYHSSAKVMVESKMNHRGTATMGAADIDSEFQWYGVSEDLVRNLRTKLDG